MLKLKRSAKVLAVLALACMGAGAAFGASADTGQLEQTLNKGTDFETFFKEAPKMNPSRSLIKGTVCGVRVEDIQEPTMREIRYLDKLIDELAKGKAMDKILRA